MVCVTFDKTNVGLLMFKTIAPEDQSHKQNQSRVNPFDVLIFQ